jgi:hypothetical protein
MILICKLSCGLQEAIFVRPAKNSTKGELTFYKFFKIENISLFMIDFSKFIPYQTT